MRMRLGTPPATTGAFSFEVPVLIQTRVDTKTTKAIRAAALADGVSVAAWLRRTAQRALMEPLFAEKLMRIEPRLVARLLELEARVAKLESKSS